MASSITIAAIVFVCVFGSALLGTLLRSLVPIDHLTADSKDTVKVATGLIGTMAALVLGLLTASAKSTFDTLDSEITQNAAHIVLLDRVLAQYGPETKETRDLIRQAVVYRLKLTWPEEASPVQIDVPETAQSLEAIQAHLNALSPQNDTQRALRSRAISISGDIAGSRWLVLAQVADAIPTPFLIVMVLWLMVLFTSFGLLAPRNATVMAALALCALSVAGSIFLILEMSRPLEGVIKVSSAPLRYALSQLGK